MGNQRCKPDDLQPFYLIESRPLTAELGQIASTIALLRNAFVWETEK